ncbi:MAG: TIGR00159 family protein, partial [Candidatus Eremiobacteraeota bacterium]|nr:TIGR00159 family protein [Candidatus Eremiobacteraeota bacterium]
MNALFSYVGITDVLDVIATSILIYYLLLLIRGTRAVQILLGILVLVGLLGLANLLHLVLLGTILGLIVVGAAVTIPIVFQPELRRALEQIGRGGLFRLDSTE